MKKFLPKIICSLFILFPLVNWAVDNIEVKIQVSKTVFFYEEPIYVHFVVTNTSSEPVVFKISDFSFLNYFLEVYSLQNVSIKEKEDFFALQLEVGESLRGNKNIQKEKFKNVTLKNSQILGQKINLLDYYNLKPGIYILKGKFYPLSSFLNPRKYVFTPYIKLIIKENIYKERDNIKKRILLKKELHEIKTPEQSVRAFFEGKIEKNWNRFFYVIDLRRLIKEFPVFYKSFKEVADNEKNNVVKDFREFLKELNSDERIREFDIIETVIRKNRAISTVIVTSRFRNTRIKREYRIGLIKKDHWYIYGYTVIQK